VLSLRLQPLEPAALALLTQNVRNCSTQDLTATFVS
jgi:hypothetical protein